MLLRALVGLEDGGGNEFFGDPQLDIADLIRTAPDGRGVISCVELPAVQDKPALFSTALMWLVAELFEELPEVGDLDKPKLVFFFDEAHLLFDGATDAFLDSVAQTVRLIRSKGVGVFFVTQTPTDVPAEVLGQLGNRVQHALRAFTPAGREGAEGDRLDLPEVRVLRPRRAADADGHRRGGGHDPLGVRRPDAGRALAAWSRRPRGWRRPTTSTQRAKASPLYAKYGTRVDAESAREKLAARVEHGGRGRAPKDAPRQDRAQGGRQGDRRRRGHDRQVPEVARGEGDAEAGGARSVRHAEEEVLTVAALVPPFTEEHEALRESLRSFVEKEIRPHAPAWEEAREFPLALFTRMGELGFLGISYPEEYGGQGGDTVHGAVFAEEMARCGSGGVAAGIGGHTGIAMPPILQVRHGGAEAALDRARAQGREDRGAGDHRAGRRSDVAGLKTFARREDGEYVVNGSKTFITNGVRADFYVTAVKTTQEGGHHGSRSSCSRRACRASR